MGTCTMEKATKENVKVGTLLRAAYGATMHRVHYYQVVTVSSSKVMLCSAESRFEEAGYDSGDHVLVGPSKSDWIITKRAKFTAAGLKLCERRYKGTRDGIEVYDEWSAGKHHWNVLSVVQPGYSEYTYGD